EDNDSVLAIQTTERVLTIDRQNVQAMILKALAEQKQKRWKVAGETLQGAIAVAPKDSTVLCMLGVNAQHLGEKDRAVDYFEQAVAANDKDAWAAQLLASVKPAPIKIEEPAPKQDEAPKQESAPKADAPATQDENPEDAPADNTEAGAMVD